MPVPPKITIRSQLPEPLYERLREYAYEMHASQAEIIRRALDEYLPRVRKRPSL